MSTVEEFEAAPIGATARSPYQTVVKTGLSTAPWVGEVRYPGGITKLVRNTSEQLVHERFILDPAPTVPASAREALDLAWELAHPVKAGDVIPEGAACFRLNDDGTTERFTVKLCPWSVYEGDRPETLRTLDRLDEIKPMWTNAPAVLAATILEDRSEHRTVFVRENKAGTQWVRDTRVYRWDELIDVVPLYPKGQDA